MRLRREPENCFQILHRHRVGFEMICGPAIQQNLRDGFQSRAINLFFWKIERLVLKCHGFHF
jgi:hypothetical protein